MSILNSSFWKKERESVKDNKNSDTSSYLKEAAQLASVIDEALDCEDYSGIKRKLNDISTVEQAREEYIFEQTSIVSNYWVIVLSVIFIIANIFYSVIGVSTIFMSEKYFTIGLGIGMFSVLLLIINSYLIIKQVAIIRFKKRFDIYVELLGFKTLEYVEDLAECVKQKESVIIKDLNQAIKKKNIPQGHFSRDNIVFMVSDTIYDKYLEKPAVYDRYFEKQLEERHRIKSRTKRITQIMDEGEQYIKKLSDYRTIVKDKTVSRKIGRLENVVSMIYLELDVNPKQVNSLGVFLNYYLPTTEKLLDRYVSIIEKKVEVPNLSKAKREIEEALNIIIKSFEGILEKVYEEYEMEISSSISALEVTMEKENL